MAEVDVTVRGLEGSALLGPRSFPRKGLVAAVRGALLAKRPPRQTVTLICDTRVLSDGALDDGEVTLTAAFAPALSEAQRRDCKAQIAEVCFQEMLPLVIARLPDAARDDPDLMMTVLEKENRVTDWSTCIDARCGLAGHFASAALRDDASFIRRAIALNAFHLECASARLRGDPDVVGEAVRSKAGTIALASDELRSDPAFVHELARASPSVLRFVSRDTRAAVMRLQAKDPPSPSKKPRTA